MRKIYLFSCIACVFTMLLAVSVQAMSISAKSCVLLEAESGAVAFEKNKDIPLPMASTTKIMTALVVLESCDVNTSVTIEPCMTGIEGSSIYLEEGEKLTVSDLLYALMLESANDAAVALAYTVGGDIDGFAQLMNEKASELGLINTHFTNPHGLDDEMHYTTAYELGVIASCAMKNSIFKEIVSTYKKAIPLNNGEGTRLLVNHNRLLKSFDGALGIKTGYTKRCGRCLVSCAERNGVTLICVTLNDPDDWRDHASLLELGFTKYKSFRLASPYDYSIELETINGEKRRFLCSNPEGVQVTLEADNVNIRAVLEANRLIAAPINKGDVVGRIVFYNNDTQIASLPLIAQEAVRAEGRKKSFIERLIG